MSEITTDRNNPFVGPRAIRTGESLYGRERETGQLTNLLIAERIVLLYSPSGAGKTSLIQAALIPRLQKRKMHLLPIVRVNLAPPAELTTQAGFNRYIYSLLTSLEEAIPEEKRIPESELAAMSLAEYLDRIAAPTSVLIFDQFEEILTVNPTDREDKLVFFAQLGEALKAPHRWVLFAMREDYIAALDPYLLPIPTRLHNTFRLDLLDKDAARQIMQKTAAEEDVDFTSEAADHLIENLCRVQIQRPDGTFNEQPGQYVEPVQLQVVCYNLWEKLDPNDRDINAEEIKDIGDVDKSLAEYYATQVATIATQSGVKERVIREWIDTHLITKSGIRNQVLMSPNETEGLSNDVIRSLGLAHLIRREQRGRTWFELAHDRLIKPVQRDNANWFETHLSLLQRRAALWAAENQAENLLLRGKELEEAETWAGEQPEELSKLDTEFLEACRKERQRGQEELERQQQAIKLSEQQRVAKTLRRLLAFAIIAAIAAGLFAVSAVLSGRAALVQASRNAELASENAYVAATAQAAEATAVIDRDMAVYAEATAQYAQATAVSDRDAAVTAQAAAIIAQAAAIDAQATAIYNADLAAENEDQARQQAALASSRRLASQAQGYLDTQPDLAALLGIEALNASDTLEAKSILLSRIQTALAQTLVEYGDAIPGQGVDINTVAISSDGQYLAWGDANGRVALWDYRNRRQIQLGTHEQAVRGVAFSPDGSLLASGGEDSQLFLWDVNTRQGKRLSGVVNIISDVKFSPDGKSLAAAVGSQVSIWNVDTCRQAERCERSANLTRGHNGLINSIAWSPDGTRLASAGEDVRVIIWEIANAGPLLLLREHTKDIAAVAWSPNNDYLASGSWDGTLVLWDLNRNERVGKPLRPHGVNSIFSLAFSANGKILASGGGDMEVNLLDVRTRESLGRLEDYHIARVNALAFSPAGFENLLVTGSLDNTVSLHEVREQQPLISTLFKLPAQILATSNPNPGKTMLAVRQARTVELWDPGQEPQNPLYSLSIQAASAVFSPKGDILALGDNTGLITLIDTFSGDVVTSFRDRESPVLALAFHPQDGSLLSSQCVEEFVSRANRPVCQRHALLFWDTGQGLVIKQLDVDHDALAIFQVSDITGHSDFIRALAFHPNGKLLATGSDDLSIQLWDLESSDPSSIVLARHTAALTSLAFSADGQTIASASSDRQLILWDARTYQTIGGALISPGEVIQSLTFNVSGDVLLAGDRGGNLSGWDVSVASWSKRNCELAGRNLTEAEWRQFFPEQANAYRQTCPAQG